MSRQILVLGATGLLGQPVVRGLVDKGHRVRVLARTDEKAREMFGDTVEIVAGSAVHRDDVQGAMAGCDAVHISLPQESELTATQHVVDLAAANGPERISYISATTACEENRWFEVIEVKMRTEQILRQSGIAHTVICPTWVMETLPNFVHGDRGVVILGKNPPPLHFFAAADFGRMVAGSYDDDRSLGKRLFIHGPEGITLPHALERFFKACHSELKVTRLKLWQARLFAKLTGRAGLAYVTRLIAYFDKVGELGDPAEANALLGAPSITLDGWFEMPKDNLYGTHDVPEG
ncbi:MAG: NAD(P)H-binding protein [bacterium]|nr:NAD(P)H-binding protein [bacterium]